MREQNYKEAVKANDPEALVAIIKMIYQRKEKGLHREKSVLLQMPGIFSWHKSSLPAARFYFVKNNSKRYIFIMQVYDTIGCEY